MPSVVAILKAIIAASALVSAAPSSPANVLLETRASNDLHCPGSDCTTYTGPGGGQFRIKCDRDSSEVQYKIYQASNFADCIQKCGSESKCKRVTFNANVDDPGTCYLKDTLGSGIFVNDGIKMATKLQYAANPCT